MEEIVIASLHSYSLSMAFLFENPCKQKEQKDPCFQQRNRKRVQFMFLAQSIRGVH